MLYTSCVQRIPETCSDLNLFHFCHRFARKMGEFEQSGRGHSSLDQSPPVEDGSPNLSYRGDREQLQVKKTSLFKRISRWRKYIILILTPILLMPIPIAVKGTVRELCDFLFLLIIVN